MGIEKIQSPARLLINEPLKFYGGYDNIVDPHSYNAKNGWIDIGASWGLIVEDRELLANIVYGPLELHNENLLEEHALAALYMDKYGEVELIIDKIFPCAKLIEFNRHEYKWKLIVKDNKELWGM